MQKKFIDVSFEIKALSEEGDFFTFEGYASTFGNIDRGGDRVIKGAFIDSIKDLKRRSTAVPGTRFKALMPVLWQHQHDNPVGSFVEMREDDQGLFVKGIMPKDDDLVSGRVMPQMKTGSVSDMSIGYSIKEHSVDDKGILNLEKLDLWETSLVTIPMNAEANITGFKHAGVPENTAIAARATEWDVNAAMGRVREHTESSDEPTKAYKDAFLYCDGDNLDEFDGYKFLVSDVIDGKLTIVPKAVFEAAAALRGARGGAKLSEENKAAAVEALNNCYEKMGVDSPFEKEYLLGANEAETLTPRQLEKFLFASKVFTKEGAKLVASKFKDIVRDAGIKQSERDATQEKDEANVLSKLNEILTLFEKENPNGPESSRRES